MDSLMPGWSFIGLEVNFIDYVSIPLGRKHWFSCRGLKLYHQVTLILLNYSCVYSFCHVILETWPMLDLYSRWQLGLILFDLTPLKKMLDCLYNHVVYLLHYTFFFYFIFFIWAWRTWYTTITYCGDRDGYQVYFLVYFHFKMKSRKR